MEKGIEYEIAMDNICKSKDAIWFVDRSYNVLFKKENNKKYCEMVLSLPNECTLEDGACACIRNTPMCFEVDNYIYCLPNRGNNILIVNLNDLQVQEIPIPNPNKTRMYMCNLWWIKDEIWTYASGLGKIYCIEQNERALRKEYCIFEEREAGRGATLVDDNIYTVSKKRNVICEFNISRREIKYYEIKNVQEGFSTIYHKDDMFWLSGISGDIYIWDKGTQQLSDKITIDKKQFKSEQEVFLNCVVVGDKVCFVPLISSASVCSKILCVESSTKKVYAYDFIVGGQTRQGNCYILDVINDEELVYCTVHESTFICRLNVNTGVMISEKGRVDKASFLKLGMMKGMGVFYEISGVTPIDMLNISKRKELQRYQCGSAIYEYIKSS